jgi:sterol desaturase/sphingolipid hydroxylase (fatty acid hydroxylase superfamily)
MAPAKKIPGVVYPPMLPTMARSLLGYVRSAAYAAAITVGLNHASVLPALLTAFKGSAAVQEFLRTNALCAWMQLTFFEGQETGGTNLLDGVVLMAGLMFFHFLAYYGLGLPLLLFDWLQVLQQYKLPRTERMHAKRSVVIHSVVETGVYHLAVQPVLLFLLYRYVLVAQPLYVSAASTAVIAAPAFTECFWLFFQARLFMETVFYGFHRALHEVPGLYRFHKQHHNYVGCIVPSAEFSHPIEQTWNYISTLGYLSYRLGGIHQTVLWVWVAFRIAESIDSHGGYSWRGSFVQKYLGLTFSEAGEFHDWHHTDNRGNYGWVWLDWLGGTMDTFQVMKNKRRAAKQQAARDGKKG